MIYEVGELISTNNYQSKYFTKPWPSPRATYTIVRYHNGGEMVTSGRQKATNQGEKLILINFIQFIYIYVATILRLR